jgi:hypothetical protein
LGGKITMPHQHQELFLAKVKAIAKGPHAPLLNELIFILSNPLNNCPNGPNDGPLGALRKIIHHVYLDFKDNQEHGSGCTFAHTCLSSRQHGCALAGSGKAKVLQFRAKTG